MNGLKDGGRDNKVLVTVNPEHPVWKEARADAGSTMLGFVSREIIAGNVAEVVILGTEWAKLHGYLSELPSGKNSLAMAIADAPTPQAPEATDRAVAARKVGELVRALGATSPFGGDVSREEAGRYYQVNFGFGPMMVGAVFVYSVGYVRVSYVAETNELPPNGLPRIDNRVFASVDDAGKFLTLAIRARKFADALAVPQRQKKEKKL